MTIDNPRIVQLVKTLFGEVIHTSALYRIPQNMLLNYLEGMCENMRKNDFDNPTVKEKDLKYCVLFQPATNPNSIEYLVSTHDGLPHQLMLNNLQITPEFRTHLEHVDNAILKISKGFHKFCRDRAVRGFTLIAYEAGNFLNCNIMPVVTDLLKEDIAILKEIQASDMVQRAENHFAQRRLQLDNEINGEIDKAGLVPQTIRGEKSSVLIGHPSSNPHNVVHINSKKKIVN